MMFKGSYTALVTPMNAGEIDLDALADLVEWQIEQGTHGLVPAGTTGESPTLSHSEHDRVVSATVEAAAGRVPVIGGAGSNNTIETVRLVQAAKDAGCDAALVVTPYYNKPTQRGLIAHYTAAAEIGLPIIIYNIPGRSVVDMSPATMGELARLDAIVGVKDSTGDITRVSHQRATCGTDFVQLSGEDASALGFNAHGGHGAISVTANVAPALCSEFQNATLEGDYVRALELQDRLMPLHTAIFQEPGLVGAKYGLSLLGKVREDVRSPLTALEDGTRLAIKDAMIAAGVLT